MHVGFIFHDQETCKTCDLQVVAGNCQRRQGLHGHRIMARHFARNGTTCVVPTIFLRFFFSAASAGMSTPRKSTYHCVLSQGGEESLRPILETFGAHFDCYFSQLNYRRGL